MLAPSAAHRWLRCLPSARIEETIQQVDTTFSREGTVAHDIASDALLFLLRGNYEIVPELQEFRQAVRDELLLDETMRQQTVGKSLADAVFGRDIEGFDSAEILSVVYNSYVYTVYWQYLQWRKVSSDTQLFVEVALNLEEFIPEGFGSCDAAVVTSGRMAIFDLKYGRGVKVNAEGNEQLRCYALGVLYGPAETFDVKQISMGIIQPRLGHVSSADISAIELKHWAVEVLKPSAEMAFRGEGLTVAGDHCRFCRAKGLCRTYAKEALSIADRGGKGDLLAPEELALLLPMLPQVTTWAKAVEETALRLALEGKEIPGFKVVEGRSVRRISKPEEALARLEQLGVDRSGYMTEPQLKGISDLERSLGRKAFREMLGDLVEKPAGKPTLAPADDPRSTYAAVSERDYANILKD